MALFICFPSGGRGHGWTGAAWVWWNSGVIVRSITRGPAADSGARGMFSEAAACSPVQLGGRAAGGREGGGRRSADVRQTFGRRYGREPGGGWQAIRQGAGKAAGTRSGGLAGKRGGASRGRPSWRSGVVRAVRIQRPRGAWLVRRALAARPRAALRGRDPLGKHRLPRGVPQPRADSSAPEPKSASITSARGRPTTLEEIRACFLCVLAYSSFCKTDEELFSFASSLFSMANNISVLCLVHEA